MPESKAFIVTGSSTGVGAATALLLASKGARVAINYSKSATEAEETAQACIKAGGEAIVVRADVAQDEDCKRLAAAATGQWGQLDGLVNNAGTTKFAPCAISRRCRRKTSSVSTPSTSLRRTR